MPGVHGHRVRSGGELPALRPAAARASQIARCTDDRALVRAGAPRRGLRRFAGRLALVMAIDVQHRIPGKRGGGRRRGARRAGAARQRAGDARPNGERSEGRPLFTGLELMATYSAFPMTPGTRVTVLELGYTGRLLKVARVQV